MQNRRKARKGTLMRLLGYFKPYRFQLISAILITIAANMFVLIGPMLSGKAIDAIGEKPGMVDFPLVFHYCLWMVVFYLASALLSFSLNFLITWIGQRVVVDLRHELFRKMEHLPVRFFDSNQVGDIVSRFQYDIDTINTSMTNDLVQLASSSVLIIGSFSMMLSISPKLVLIFLVTIPLIVKRMQWRIVKFRPIFRERSRKQGEFNGKVEELLSASKTIKSYACEDEFLTRFDEKDKEALDSFYRADYNTAKLGPTFGLINNLTLALIGIVGSILYILGGISLGGLSSFVLYSRKFTGPISECANIITEVQSAFSAADRVFRMLDEETEADDPDNAEVLEEIKGDVDMDDIDFGYDEKRNIIEGLKLHARPGELIAIVGPTGAGKSTIMNLLMRFYDPQSGRIRVDGKENSSLTRSSLRSSFAMVLQDSWLFEGSIRENIAYGTPEATMEEIENAAIASGISSYIDSLPDGYDTIITENGGNLSQGQRQMLTIARAMLQKRKMLILDEATSNVDTRTEMKIQEAMEKLMKDKTCFVIAHRLSTVRNADEIIVLNNGLIREQGSHEELLKLGGTYAELYNSQFK